MNVMESIPVVMLVLIVEMVTVVDNELMSSVIASE